MTPRRYARRCRPATVIEPAAAPVNPLSSLAIGEEQEDGAVVDDAVASYIRNASRARDGTCPHLHWAAAFTSWVWR